jgi:hypothetical protein
MVSSVHKIMYLEWLGRVFQILYWDSHSLPTYRRVSWYPCEESERCVFFFSPGRKHTNKYMLLTLYHGTGSRDISDICPRHPHFTIMTWLREILHTWQVVNPSSSSSQARVQILLTIIFLFYFLYSLINVYLEYATLWYTSI